MKGRTGYLTFWDGCLVAILALLALIAWPLVGGQTGTRVIVERKGQVLFSAPLDTDRSVTLEGPCGPTVISIEKGRVRVSESSCPQHVCQKQGAIGAHGETLACLPNGLLIRIAGRSSAPKDYDFLSR